MEEHFVKKIRRTGTSLGVNIPKEIIEVLKLNEGDIIKVRIKKMGGV